MSNTKQSAACDQRSSCLIHSTLKILQKRGGILLQLPQPLRQESNWQGDTYARHDSQWWSHGMLKMNELSPSVETGQAGCSGLLSIAHGLFLAWLYPFSLEKVLQLLALKLVLSSVLKLCCILWKHHREVSLPLLSIGTTFFLLKSDIFHSDAGKRLIFLKRGWMGIVVPVVPRLLDWFSQCLLRDHSFQLAQRGL